MNKEPNNRPTPPPSNQAVAPQAPAQAAGQPAPMPPVKPKNKTGLIIGIVSGVIGLLIVIVGIILALVVFSKPSTKDYAAAADELNAVTATYNKATTAFTYYSSSISSTKSKDNAETLKNVKAVVNEGLDKLGKMKAVKGDSDVKARYVALKDKQEAFNTAIDALIEAYGVINPIFDSKKLNSSSSEAMMSSIKSVRTELESVKSSINNQHNKKFVDDAIAAIKKFEEAATKYIEMSKDWTKYDRNVTQDYYNAYRALRNVDSGWSSSLKKLGEEGEIKNQLNDLAGVLMDKQFRR